MNIQGKASKLAPEVSRILYVKHLPFKITTEELYDLFGRYGAIRQIRLGNTDTTKGKAFVIYEDIFDAQKALDKLSGFSVGGRYLMLSYFRQSKSKAAAAAGGKPAGAVADRAAAAKDKEELSVLKAKYGVA